MDYSNIFGFGQQPQYNLATAGNGVAVPNMAGPMDYSGIYSLGQPADYSQFAPSNTGSFGMNTATPTAGAAPQGFFGKAGDWLSNGNNLQTVVSGISALGQAWLGFQQLNQAKDALNFQKKAFNINLTNQTKDYNTSLEDRIRGRTADYAGKEADVQKYLAAHSL